MDKFKHSFYVQIELDFNFMFLFLIITRRAHSCY